MSDSLHLVRLSLVAPRMFALARRLRLPLQQTDLGYLVHATLRSLFGDLAPAPFAIDAGRGAVAKEGAVSVLGYAGVDRGGLEAQARSFADPDAWEACLFESLSSKPMPTAFEPHHRLGFSVRACPIVRSKSERHPDGRELDAFLAECIRVGGDVRVSREDVYRRWLTRELARDGAASLEHGELVRMQRDRLVRRTQGSERKARVLDRPDVTLEGALRVEDPTGFRKLLARGVGRHRAFGFGMLLLRPLRSDRC